MAVTKPTIGQPDWGDELNTALDYLDAQGVAAQASASAAVTTANSAASDAADAASDAATALSTAEAAQNTADAAETTLGSQNKATAAETAAKNYAVAQDALLDTRIDALEGAVDYDKTIALPNSLTKFKQVNIPDDGGDTSTWPDKFAMYFNGTRTGYFNEFGELRARGHNTGAVALRAMGHVSGTSTGSIFEVGPSLQPSTAYFKVSQTLAEATVPLSTTQYLLVNGTRIYVSATDPGAVPDGSVWIDIS